MAIDSEETFDPVPEITRAHFEEAMAGARKSVTDYDLQKYNEFRNKFEAHIGGQGSFRSAPSIHWPEAGETVKEEDEDIDLYA